MEPYKIESRLSRRVCRAEDEVATYRIETWRSQPLRWLFVHMIVVQCIVMVTQ